MSTIQRVALAFGVVFVVVTILGFMASGTSMEADPDAAPKIVGLFPVNVLHNLVHLGFGVWGLVASRTPGAALVYARIGGVAYLALAALAFVTPDLFGLVPIGGHDIWLHALLGIALAAAGFTMTAPATRAAMM
jgi:hypothetical protein